MFSDLAKDERGLIGFTLTKDKTESKNDEILYSEEVLAMVLGFGRTLVETQAGGYTRDCVITVPSYFTSV